MKKFYITVLESLTGVCGLSVGTFVSAARVGSTVGVPIVSRSASIASVAGLISNEQCSKPELRYPKLKDWINVITILYDKTLNVSMVDQKN